MSCRAACGHFEPEPPIGSDLAELYLDLAGDDRRDDFRWLALSQGVPVERVDDLWRELKTRRR